MTYATTKDRYQDEVQQFLDASVLALKRGKEVLSALLRLRAMENWKQLLMTI